MEVLGFPPRKIDGERTNGQQFGSVPDPLAAYREVVRELEALKHDRKRVARKLRAESELRPWQVELLKLQRHLEAHRMRMIVLCEGRDAAGKGGTIRRVTRYMNEKHYRVVALGKPTEDQRSEWYFQRYVAQLPAGGEIVLFDRSWYNRAMVEPVFGFCTAEEYENFMLGVTGFEKDLVRQGTFLVKLYFSVTKEEQARRFARRLTDPLRQWKFSEIDTQAQDRWDEFTHRK
jgi:polyphosphate kinase 2